MKKRKPLSKIRYDAKKPGVTFRMDKEEKESLLKMSETSGKTITEIIRNYMFHPVYGAIIMFIQRLEYGVTRFSEQNQPWYFCAICNEKIPLKPNTRPHHAMVQYMLDHGWGHSECHAKNRKHKK